MTLLRHTFAAIMAALTLGSAAHAATDRSALRRIATIEVPGGPLAHFDIGYAAGGFYALADRSHAALDLIDARTRRFLAQIPGFAGMQRGGQGGPNGVVIVDGRQAWVGDGHSKVRIVDLATRKIVATVDTGGSKQVDELAYDPQDHLVIAANNDDKPPFVTLISTRTPYSLRGRVALPRASSGLEQPVWDSRTSRVYITIPELDGKLRRGGVAEIDPRATRLLRTMTVERCMPAGLALGPGGRLLLGCSDDGVAAGFPARSMLLDAGSGQVRASFDKVGGSDEVWYDPHSRRYELAAVANPGGPVLGLIDARAGRWIGNVPTGYGAHSVAADPVSGQIYVPIAAGDRNCPSGCIAVFGRDSPHAATAPRQCVAAKGCSQSTDSVR